MKIKSLFESIFDNVIILEEGVNYAEMFNRIEKYIDKIEAIKEAIYPHSSQYNELTMLVEDLQQEYNNKVKYVVIVAKDLSERQDVRVWFTRIGKIHVLEALMRRFVSFRQLNTSLFTSTELQSRLDSIQKTMESELNELHLTLIGDTFHRPLDEVRHNLAHYLSLPIPEIQNFRFEKQHTYVWVIMHFIEIEERWRSSNQGAERIVPEQGTKIMEFGDGFAWYDLEDASCDAEGDSMKHCGNSPSASDPDQTIFSLREKTEFGLIPHLTFVYHIREKGLGERKGYGNSKPAAKYHKYIEALIMEPYIEYFFDDRSYMPEEDFQITDLPNWKQIWNQKPGLLTFEQYIDVAGIDDYVISKIEFLQRDMPIEEIDNKTIRFRHEMTNNINDIYVRKFARELSGNITYSVGEVDFLLHLTSTLYMYDYEVLYGYFSEFLFNKGIGTIGDLPRQTMIDIRNTLTDTFEDLLMENIMNSQGMEGRVHVWYKGGGAFIPIGETHFPATMDNQSSLSIMINKPELVYAIYESSARLYNNVYSLSIAEVKFELAPNFGFAVLFDRITGDVDGVFGEGWGDRVSSINDPADFLMNDPLVSKHFQRFIPQMKNVIETYYNNLGFELPQ